MAFLFEMHLVMVAICLGAVFPPVKTDDPLKINLVKPGSIALKVTGEFAFTAVRPTEKCLNGNHEDNSVQFTVGDCGMLLKWNLKGCETENEPISTKGDVKFSFIPNAKASFKDVKGEPRTEELVQACRPQLKDVEGQNFKTVTFDVKKVDKPKCTEISIQFPPGVERYDPKRAEKDVTPGGKNADEGSSAWIFALVAVLVAVAVIACVVVYLRRKKKAKGKHGVTKDGKNGKKTEDKTETKSQFSMLSHMKGDPAVLMEMAKGRAEMEAEFKKKGQEKKEKAKEKEKEDMEAAKEKEAEVAKENKNVGEVKEAEKVHQEVIVVTNSAEEREVRAKLEAEEKAEALEKEKRAQARRKLNAELEAERLEAAAGPSGTSNLPGATGKRPLGHSRLSGQPVSDSTIEEMMNFSDDKQSTPEPSKTPEKHQKRRRSDEHERKDKRKEMN